MNNKIYRKNKQYKMKQIIKKILYQKLYSRYKEIFEIDIDEIIEI
ncbi:MAG: hypothetical protein Q8S84_02095 [bacterium]|nr:hypothetical protein [bacterium]MDP3380347.1 hypothetical protein [bacterium]